MSSFRTFLWVVPLTVLIWIYAEREQLVVVQRFTFKAEPRNDETNRLVRIDQFDGTLVADLSGPHGRLEQVQQKLAATGIQIPVDQSLGRGQHRIQTSAIGNDPLFVSNGVTVTHIQPTELTVTVDPMVTKAVDVQPRPDERGSLEEGYTFEPAQVQISVPESVLREHPNLFAWADLKDLSTPGPHTEPAAIVPSVSDSNIKLSRPTVEAKFTVKRKDITDTIDSIAVWQKLPALPSFWASHHVEYKDSVTNVKVVGAPEIIAKLKNRSVLAKASFEVAAIDTTSAPGAEYRATLHFELPPGVTSPDEGLPIQYKIVENKPGDQ